MPHGICPACAHRFYAKHARQKHCSRPCAWRSRPNHRLHRRCAACASPFEVGRAEARRHAARYCSRPCISVGKAREAAVRFWTFVDRSGGPHACWPWRGGRNAEGYGSCRVEGRRTERAHRVAYELTYGRLLPGFQVCHSCDNPPCCNPRHLWPGTHQHNMQDAQRKGRMKIPRRRVA